MPSIQAQLDHVVLLVPYKDLVDPPKWITDHFTLSPGGRHADGKTENRLVIFADGSYLELIAFIDDDPKHRLGHWWDKPYGVVDYALTTPDETFAELGSIKERLASTDTGISYSSPKEGGRLKPDGQELRWRVTFPEGTSRGKQTLGTVPFFCHDVTPRSRRVPDENTRHPSGVLGMAGVLLEVQEASVSRLSSATAAILDHDLEGEGRYGLEVPHEVRSAKKPSIRIQHAAADAKKEVCLSIVLQTTQHLPDIRHQIEDGTVSVVFELPSR
ncbi:Hypothetical predicted protein [Lecanosticta acicola]|uniref:Glyoxalase-like domain-containing protein n=1 Tax=Lecanosticta acicola TaxID=111012 RepID=A0AAI9ECT2_9PEZI|nr:Hypothetical predicted protein [Lecanosticta acicola]